MLNKLECHGGMLGCFLKPAACSSSVSGGCLAIGESRAISVALISFVVKTCSQKNNSF